MSDYTQLFDALATPIEDALRASIQRFGVLVPVVRDQNGRMIDGRHRARIADQIGAKYRVDVVNVADEDEAKEIQRTLNADRRHLSGDQLREHIFFLAAETNEAGVGKYSENTISRVVGVDQKYVNRTLRDEQVRTSPNLPPFRKGADGKVYPAKRPTIVPARDEREAGRAQAALTSLGDHVPSRSVDVKRIERIAREHQADQRRAEPIVDITVEADVEIRHGDFRQALAGVRDVAAIITDPPYPREFISLFGDLGALAARVLTPSGVLAAMTGQSHLRAYLDELDQHLSYRWVGAYIVQGPRNRVHAAKVGTGWKPILLYTRRDAVDVPFLLDDLFDSAGDDKQHHHWGQSESGIADLVERLTKPGDLVVDPFLGGGTTAVVCKELGRRFIGCDLDANAVRTSRERVA